MDAVQSVITILLMISLGYILARIGWFNRESSKLFAKIVVNVSLPSLMLSNLLNTFSKDKLFEVGYGLLIPFGIIGLSYLIGMVVSRIINVPHNRRGAFRSMFALSNAIFIGLPVNLGLFGEKSIPYILMYYFANTLIFWTIGVYGIRKDGNVGGKEVSIKETLGKILSPPLVAFLLAMILIMIDFKLPRFLDDSLQYIGNLTTPLSMLFIGITIYSMKPGTIKFDKSMFILHIGRFLITPLIAIGLIRLITVPDLMGNVFVIQATMPVMTQTAIVTQVYGADYEYSTVMVSISTLVSLLFILFYSCVLSI